MPHYKLDSYNIYIDFFSSIKAFPLHFFLCIVKARPDFIALPHSSHLFFSASLLAFMLACCAAFSFFMSSHSLFVLHSGSRHMRNGLPASGLTCIIGVLHSSHCFSAGIIMPSL